jgi:rhodanese-related sulfurtransferase
VKPTIDQYLEQARARLDRVHADNLGTELTDGALLVDIRPVEQRDRDGHIGGALVIDRNVLEWRLAPSSDHRIIDLEDGQRVILFCDEGYASSLAAEALLMLGIEATDLVGGYQAWLKQ